MSTKVSRVFICYRHADTQIMVDRVASLLTLSYRSQQIVRDIAAVVPGRPLPDQIVAAIEGAELVLAFIGPGWEADARLDQDGDWVRAELELALEKSIPVIPVLVSGRTMPMRQELPESLQALADYPAIELRNDPYFAADYKRLKNSLRPYVKSPFPTRLAAAAAVGVALISAYLATQFFASTADGAETAHRFLHALDQRQFEKVYDDFLSQTAKRQGDRNLTFAQMDQLVSARPSDAPVNRSTIYTKSSAYGPTEARPGRYQLVRLGARYPEQKHWCEQVWLEWEDDQWLVVGSFDWPVTTPCADDGDALADAQTAADLFFERITANDLTAILEEQLSKIAYPPSQRPQTMELLRTYQRGHQLTQANGAGPLSLIIATTAGRYQNLSGEFVSLRYRAALPMGASYQDVHLMRESDGAWRIIFLWTQQGQ